MTRVPLSGTLLFVYLHLCRMHLATLPLVLTLPTRNRCFSGTKLWLVAQHSEENEALLWCDTCGLSDTPRDCFNLQLGRFLRVLSSRIVVVKDGECFFLPRGYFHRVYTLTSYVGVALFYLSVRDMGRIFREWIF